MSGGVYDLTQEVAKLRSVLAKVRSLAMQKYETVEANILSKELLILTESVRKQ